MQATAQICYRVDCPSCEEEILIEDPTLPGDKTRCPMCDCPITIRSVVEAMRLRKTKISHKCRLLT